MNTTTSDKGYAYIRLGGDGATKPTHFGDPCIHCGVAHDDVAPGPCTGDAAKAIPIAYRSLGVRPDGVEHFLYRLSTGEVRQQYSHISEHAPYYHFGRSDELISPPRYDANIRLEP